MEYEFYSRLEILNCESGSPDNKFVRKIDVISQKIKFFRIKDSFTKAFFASSEWKSSKKKENL